MMHARQQRRLSEYLDGALAGRAKQRIERHLERCAECRATLVELRGTVLLLRSLPAEEEPSEFLATRVLASLEESDAAPDWRERVRLAVARAFGSVWAPAFSAVALLFVVATLLRVQVVIRAPWDEAPAQGPLAAQALAPLPERESNPLRGDIRLVTSSVRSRHRFDPVVLEEVAGVERACAASPHDSECQAFRNQLVTLALANPPGFLRELESLPLESRDRVLSAVSLEAARTGHAQRVIRGLRSVDDPRAFPIVVRFQRTIASRE